jgi:hypothetical protein
MNKDRDNAISSALAWGEEIVTWFNQSQDWLNATRQRHTFGLEDPMETRPEPLSLLVRNDWRVPGQPIQDEDSKPVEYEILLSTGGPASRLVGELNKYGEATSVTLQYQDWFTKWEAIATTTEMHEALLAYVATFYFGE